MENNTLSGTGDLQTLQSSLREIEALRNANEAELERKIVHDVNNSLAKITNALWLLEQEADQNSEHARQYIALIQQELDFSRNLLRVEAL